MDLASLDEATRLAGFELMWVDLLVTGAVIRTPDPQGEETFALHLGAADQDILLIPGDSDRTRRNYTEVGRWAGEEGSRLRIRGRAHSHADAPPAMSISTFSVVQRDRR